MSIEQRSSSRRVILLANQVAHRLAKILGFELYVLPAPAVIKGKTAGPDEFVFSQGTNWVRLPMYRQIWRVLSQKMGAGEFEGKLGTEIGGSEGTLARMMERLGAKVEIAPNYPFVDLQALPFADCSYDFVISDQVLEHVRRPWKAAAEIKRVLRPAGVSICTSVLVYPIHMSYTRQFGDYYRYTPEGMRAIFEGFEVVDADGWGNADALKLAYNQSERGPEGPPPLPREKLLASSIYNRSDSMNQIVTWCIARKPD